MKKALTILVAVLVLAFALGCVAYAEEYSGEDYFEAADNFYVGDFWDLIHETDGVFVKYEPFEPTKCEQKEDGIIGYYRIPLLDEETGEPLVDEETGEVLYGDPIAVPIDGLGHVWDIVDVVVDQRATCTQEGKYHNVWECWRCEEVRNEYVDVPMIDHDFRQDVQYTDPENGIESALIKAPKCPTVTNPTGTPGEGCWTCANCGFQDPTSVAHGMYEIPADHQWGTWTVKIAPSCPGTDPDNLTGYGKRVHICSICKLAEDEAMDPLDHFGEDSTEPAGDFRLDCWTYTKMVRCTNCGQVSAVDEDGIPVAVSGEDPVELDYNQPQHRWGAWVPYEVATCVDPAMEVRYCVECNPDEDWADPEDPEECAEIGVDYRTVGSPLGHLFDGRVLTTPLMDDGHYYHYQQCQRPGCLYKDAEPYYDVDEEAVVFDNVKKVDHDWNDWQCFVEPIEGETDGYWTRSCAYRACREVDIFTGTQKEFDDYNNPLHPVLTTGIVKDEDGAFRLYEMGQFDEDFTGIYDGYNYVLEKSGKWYVVEGIWENDAMGATLVGETWYFLANGKVQEVTQLAEYQGKWFYVVNGVIDTSKTALVDYNGGKFVVAKGRIVDEYNGLWQNAKSIGGDDSWYYVANGQVQTQYTGLVEYDGEWFYVENGKLVPFNGTVEYDGEKFEVKDGMVVA